MIPKDDLPISERQRQQGEIIMTATAAACGLTREELHLRTRKHEISHARFLAAHLMRGMTKLSLLQITFLLSGDNTPRFDHGNIVYGIKKIWKWIISDSDFQKQHKALAKSIRLELDQLEPANIVPLKLVS